MELPYTTEVYFASLAGYNAQWAWAVAALAVLVAIACGLAARPMSGRERMSAQLVGVVLGVAWLWVGAVHQHRHMATLDFMAPVYGWAWVAQAALIFATCVVAGRPRFRFTGDLRSWAGLAIALFGLVGYALVAWALGYDPRGLPVAGTAPDPTAIVTVGILLMARPRPPLYLLIVPLGWAGVAAVSGHLLRFSLDYAVTAAVVVAVALAIAAWARRALAS